MIRGLRPSALFVAVALSATSCILPPREESPATVQRDLFTVSGHEVPQRVVEDVANELALRGPAICLALAYQCTAEVQVELFTDQDELDREGMNPEMKGYYAYSGDDLIQMVSPLQPFPGIESNYHDRVQIAVHEYVHLVNDRVNPEMPTWMDEGVAVYVAPHEVYEYVTHHRFPFDMVPSMRQLDASYETVPGADLFAFALVEFIASQFGQESLNQLIRSPESMEEILGVGRTDLERQWMEYMEIVYRSEH